MLGQVRIRAMLILGLLKGIVDEMAPLPLVGKDDPSKVSRL